MDKKKYIGTTDPKEVILNTKIYKKAKSEL